MVKALMAVSIKFNLPRISPFVAVVAVLSPVKSLIVVNVNAVFPVARTLKFEENVMSIFPNVI